MKIVKCTFPVPHIIIDEFYGEEINKGMMEECLSLYGKTQSGDVVNPGGARGVNNMLKKNRNLYLDSYWHHHRQDSRILPYIDNVLWSKEMKELYSEMHDLSFKSLCIVNADTTLLSAYKDGDYYDYHRDMNFGLCTFNYMVAKEPLGFTGGEFVLCGIDPSLQKVKACSTAIPFKNDRMVIFPAVTLHKVLPITTTSDHPENWRWTIQTFPQIRI